jgi:hypothetical protein
MAVSNTTVEQIYTGDGANLTFAIPFQFIKGDTASIYVYTLSSVGVRALVNPNAYTFDPDSITPANIIFLVAPALNQKIIVSRVMPLTQILTYINDGPFKNEDHEKALNRLTFMVQQLGYFQGFYPNILDKATMGLQLELAEENCVLMVNADKTQIIMGPTADDIANAQGYATAAAASAAAALVSQQAAEAAALQALSFEVLGTKAAPIEIDAAVGIPAPTAHFTTMFVKLSTAGAPISANPQIAAGAFVGQQLKLIGCDDTDYIDMDDSNGLDQAQLLRLGDKSVSQYTYIGNSIWQLDFNNGIMP